MKKNRKEYETSIERGLSLLFKIGKYVCLVLLALFVGLIVLKACIAPWMQVIAIMLNAYIFYWIFKKLYEDDNISEV